MDIYSPLFGLFFIMCIFVSAANDFYKILGVNRKASNKEIKKAFRKLALKYHPDRNSEPDAESRFRDIAEAYETLGNEKKKRQYDMFGSGENDGGSENSHHQHQNYQNYHNDGFNFDFDGFYKHFDESMKNHQHGGFKSHFGTHFGFNFDSLWEDDEEEHAIHGFHDVHDSINNMHKTLNDMKFGSIDDFGFDIGGWGEGQSAFAQQNHNKQHAYHHAYAHSHAHAHAGNGRAHAHAESGGSGQKCVTRTQKIGNTVTSFTQCS